MMIKKNIGILLGIISLMSSCDHQKTVSKNKEPLWFGAKKERISSSDTLVAYGRELIENTSSYLGPEGSVAKISNGMNCQNCHLDGGTQPWGNNYGGVAANYPKYRDRSGSVESIEKRVNDCLQRSLNGKAIDSLSKEMKAIVAYMHWLGDSVPKGTKPKGVGIMELEYLDRAADPLKGELVYTSKCVVCHGKDGSGISNKKGGYVYPPLWGEHSYNTGAGIFRLSRLAGYVKANMPFLQAKYDKPMLTDEEAWDVAAFINSRPRPVKDLTGDWPDISKKPIDHPFGPYKDGFTEEQHKFGPFKEIVEYKKSNK